MAQQARIDIKTEDEAEAAAAEAESTPEYTDLSLELDATIMELSADNEDTDKQIDGTVPEYWKHADVEAT